MNGSLAGILALSDRIRPMTRSVISDLAEEGVRSVLLTGDHRRAAEYYAGQAGIQTVCAELLPEEKAARIQEMQDRGGCVCMIGDGVNDAAALETADVGIAMGDIGSDIAAESADVVLMRDDLSVLPFLRNLSEATRKTIRLSIGASMALNLTALVFSVAGVLSPTMGALVHNIGAVLVVMMAGFLYYDRRPAVRGKGRTSAGKPLFAGISQTPVRQHRREA